MRSSTSTGKGWRWVGVGAGGRCRRSNIDQTGDHPFVCPSTGPRSAVLSQTPKSPLLIKHAAVYATGQHVAPRRRPQTPPPSPLPPKPPLSLAPPVGASGCGGLHPARRRHGALGALWQLPPLRGGIHRVGGGAGGCGGVGGEGSAPQSPARSALRAGSAAPARGRLEGGGGGLQSSAGGAPRPAPNRLGPSGQRAPPMRARTPHPFPRRPNVSQRPARAHLHSAGVPRRRGAGRGGGGVPGHTGDGGGVECGVGFERG